MEYPVHPDAIATALSAHLYLETGVLATHTLYMRQDNSRTLVIDHRPRQKTALFLEGSDHALVIPLPDLLLIRFTHHDQSPDYRVYAVKGRPPSLEAELYHAPLPNIYPQGSVCWGSVPQVPSEALKSTTLTEDWARLLGSPFGTHAVQGKSKTFLTDIRHCYVTLEQKKAKVYPTKDLVKMGYTLQTMLERLWT